MTLERIKTYAQKEGFAQGREQQAIESAKIALALNLPIAQILKITGLPLEKILELQKTIPVETNA